METRAPHAIDATSFRTSRDNSLVDFHTGELIFGEIAAENGAARLRYVRSIFDPEASVRRPAIFRRSLPPSLPLQQLRERTTCGRRTAATGPPPRRRPACPRRDGYASAQRRGPRRAGVHVHTPASAASGAPPAAATGGGGGRRSASASSDRRCLPPGGRQPAAPGQQAPLRRHAVNDEDASALFEQRDDVGPLQRPVDHDARSLREPRHRAERHRVELGARHLDGRFGNNVDARRRQHASYEVVALDAAAQALSPAAFSTSNSARMFMASSSRFRTRTRRPPSRLCSRRVRS